MKVVCLKSNPKQYSSNAYLILGDWNCMEDVNTLIDVGADDFILDEIAGISTGFGKKPVQQVVITHGHFDHCAGIKFIREKYSSVIYGFSSLPFVEQGLQDGQLIRCGDRDFEVIYTPGHSNDSICLYCKNEEILFSGDTPLFIKTLGGSYTADFIKTLERLIKLQISVVYPGHGEPVTSKIREMLETTLRNVCQSQIVIL